MATSATDLDTDWFDANFRQVLGIAGAAEAGRPIAAPQVLTALGKRFVRVKDRGSQRVTFTRTGEALQLMDDPAEIDPLLATFAASQLGGPRAALATIDADSCVSGSCEGDAGRALATIRETLDTLAEVSARRDGSFRARLLISQLVGVRRGAAGAEEFGLVYCLRRRVEEGHRQSPSFAREQALDILDLAIKAIGTFGDELGARACNRRRPLHDVVETLHRCAVHIGDRVAEVRRTLAGLGIGQCELERAGREGGLPLLRQIPVSIPALFAALETQPLDWRRIIDGATPDSQAAVADSVRDLAQVLDGLEPGPFADLFNLGEDGRERVHDAWARFHAYASAVLHDLRGSLSSTPASMAAAAGRGDDEALIEAPEEEQKPLQD